MKKTCVNRRITARSRAAYGEDDGRVVVLPLVTDESDEAETNKLRSHLSSFLPSHDRGEIAEPLQSTDRSKAVFVYDSTASNRWLRSFLNIHQLCAFCTFMVLGKSIGGIRTGRRVIWLATDEAAEEDGDDGLRDDDLVVGSSTFEMEKLDADGLGSEDVLEVVCIDAIFRDETFKDVETLGSEDVSATIFEEVRALIGSVFDESSIHEVLTHRLGHIPCHGEGRRRGGRHYS